MPAEYSPPTPVELPGLGQHASPTLAEADRIMTVCNACRYCEGLCAVFPAMERRRLFTDGDIDFLANLCHNCGACLYDCQYAPPHEFDIGVPSNLAQLRKETWERYVWPSPMAALYRRNAVSVTAALVLAVVVFVLAVSASMGQDFFEAQAGPGAFYEVVPHGVIVGVFLAALGYGMAAMMLSLRRYWRAIGGGGIGWSDLAQAGRSASTLEYLDGGGVGCMNEDEHPTDTREVFNQQMSICNKTNQGQFDFGLFT